MFFKRLSLLFGTNVQTFSNARHIIFRNMNTVPNLYAKRLPISSNAQHNKMPMHRHDCGQSHFLTSFYFFTQQRFLKVPFKLKKKKLTLLPNWAVTLLLAKAFSQSGQHLNNNHQESFVYWHQWASQMRVPRGSLSD